jgi:hypothetical protein
MLQNLPGNKFYFHEVIGKSDKRSCWKIESINHTTVPFEVLNGEKTLIPLIISLSKLNGYVVEITSFRNVPLWVIRFHSQF